MNEALRADQVTRQFRKGSKPLDVLCGVDLVVEQGELAIITGASGTGKSTLLHILGALDPPTSGEVHIQGTKVDFARDRAMSEIRNTSVGFVFQAHHLLPDFDALENVMLPARIRGESPSSVEDRAVRILTDLGLCDRFHHWPHELSGGEQQRVAVGRALINEPSILLLDEPTGNLDRETGEALMDLLRRTQRSRTLSAVMVTHNESLIRWAGKVYRLENGGVHPRDTLADRC